MDIFHRRREMFQTLQKPLTEKSCSASNSSLDSSIIQNNYLECQLLNSRHGPFPVSLYVPPLLISSRRMLALLEKLKSTCLEIRYTYEVSTNMFYFHVLPKRFSQIQYKIMACLGHEPFLRKFGTNSCAGG